MPEIIEIQKTVNQLAPAFTGRSILYIESLTNNPRGEDMLTHYLPKHKPAAYYLQDLC